MSVIFKELRINEEIRVPEVRLIAEEGNEQLGVLPIAQALAIAAEKNLDLWRFLQLRNRLFAKLWLMGVIVMTNKRVKTRGRIKKVVNIKEVKLRLNIEDHDFETKAKNGEKFLRSGDKLKVTIMFRGREITHADLGMALCKRMEERLAEVSAVERHPKLEGRNMIMILTPETKLRKRRKNHA